jgi:hypothetical protein
MMLSASSSPTTSEETPPSFFVDRSLGLTVTARLRSLGWAVVSINEIYANDAQEVDDKVWIEYGSSRGWAMLTKDKRIRRKPQFDWATTPIFALADGTLSLNAMVARFERSRRQIWKAATGDREFWHVYERTCARVWPG